MFELNTATLTLVLGVLVFLTNAIVEVIKMTFNVSGSNLINQIALAIGIILTVAAYLAYTAYTEAFVVWYYLLGAVVAGFVVALISMVGYDKVLKMWQQSQRSE